MDARRLAYLEAMEIPVWVSRGAADDAPEVAALSLHLGPGSSGLLLVCASQEIPASALAHDIVRILPETPVWAWPSADVGGAELPRAVEERLFTSILVFGGALAEQVCGHAAPERIGPARLMVTDDFRTLAERPESRRSLWQMLCSRSLVRAR